MAKSQGVRIDAEPWPDGLAMLGDADRLRQLFLAVINNAIRYSHSGDAVTLAARRSMGARPAIEVSIRDQGIGIAPDDLPHIFERGFRSQIAKDHAPDGSGLGLPIARMLARGHGGDIALRSPPEGGTIATVTLPLTPSGETP
jgi:signal transduction histidine kinase